MLVSIIGLRFDWFPHYSGARYYHTAAAFRTAISYILM